MAPRSPTLAFEPTPALERNKENYSPFNDLDEMKSASDQPRPEKSGRGVHFPDIPMADSPARRAQSIATTTVPLLPSVPSASRLPKRSPLLTAAMPDVDLNAYFEQARSLVETQRLNHEHDKKAWDEERKLWNTERQMLQNRIADLEFRLNKTKGGSRRRYSNESPNLSSQSFRSDISSLSTFSMSHSSRNPSQTKHDPPPIWEGPAQAPPAQRVFSHDSDIVTTLSTSQLPSISEDEAASFSSLSQEMSPTSMHPLARAESIPVPIEEIDSRLDGITLKSSALAPSFVAKVKSPSQTSSPAHSPSPRPKKASEVSLSIDTKTLLDPLDEKLTRYAGHTPMNFEGIGSSTIPSTDVSTPTKMKAELCQETPPEPAPTRRPPVRPTEDSNGYFSFTKVAVDMLDAAKGEYRTEDVVLEMEGEKLQVPHAGLESYVDGDNDTHGRDEEDLEDDPHLRGPLMLDPKNRTETSHDFLDKVDQKLMEAAGKSNGDSRSPRKDEGEENDFSPPERDGLGLRRQNTKIIRDEEGMEEEKDFEMPRLRIRQSTNFGSAYGASQPGNI